MAAGGFEDVTVESATAALDVPPPRELLWQSVRSTPLAAPLAQAGADTRKSIEQEITAAWQPDERPVLRRAPAPCGALQCVERGREKARSGTSTPVSACSTVHTTLPICGLAKRATVLNGSSRPPTSR